MIFKQESPEDIAQNWIKYRQVLLPAFRQRIHVHCVDDYYPLLINGDAELWTAKDDELHGCVVTQIDKGSSATILSVLSLAGKNLHKWISLLDEALTNYAEQQKCDAIEAVTRRGFSRFVPDFIEDGVVYVKIIEVNHVKEN